jgi:hypothetical protein
MRRSTWTASSSSTRASPGLDKDGLRTCPIPRDRLGSGVVIVASENDGKVSLVVSVTPDLTKRARRVSS